MTTILADARLGIMVSDSSVSDGDRVWLGRKIYRCKGSLLGFAGGVLQSEQFLLWWQNDCQGKPPKFNESQALVLNKRGLFSFHLGTDPERIDKGIDAIGSGGKAAICTYQALGWANPVKAVSIVCCHDAGSRKPVRKRIL